MQSIHPVDLVANNIEHLPLPAETQPGICAITGREEQCVPFKSCFGSNFTNLNILAAPASGLVGVNAYQAIKHKPARMSSWLATETSFTRFGKSVDGDGWRLKILDCIFSPPEGPWAAYITTSYKKHGILSVPLNSPGMNIWLFEMLKVDCADREKVREYWDRLNVALRGGISRPILGSLCCPAFVMRKIGLGFWLEFAGWARDKYQSPLYKFLCYLLPSQEDLKRESV